MITAVKASAGALELTGIGEDRALRRVHVKFKLTKYEARKLAYELLTLAERIAWE